MGKYYTKYTKEVLDTLKPEVETIRIMGYGEGKHYRSGDFDMEFSRRRGKGANSVWLDINGNVYDNSKLAKHIQLLASEMTKEGMFVETEEEKAETMYAHSTKTKSVKKSKTFKNMTNFNASVYGISVAKQTKKNPVKTGKKMARAWKNML